MKDKPPRPKQLNGGAKVPPAVSPKPKVKHGSAGKKSASKVTQAIAQLEKNYGEKTHKTESGKKDKEHGRVEKRDSVGRVVTPPVGGKKKLTPPPSGNGTRQTTPTSPNKQNPDGKASSGTKDHVLDMSSHSISMNPSMSDSLVTSKDCVIEIPDHESPSLDPLQPAGNVPGTVTDDNPDEEEVVELQDESIQTDLHLLHRKLKNLQMNRDAQSTKSNNSENLSSGPGCTDKDSASLDNESRNLNTYSDNTDSRNTNAESLSINIDGDEAAIASSVGGKPLQPKPDNDNPAIEVTSPKSPQTKSVEDLKSQVQSDSKNGTQNDSNNEAQNNVDSALQRDLNSKAPTPDDSQPSPSTDKPTNDDSEQSELHSEKNNEVEDKRALDASTAAQATSKDSDNNSTKGSKGEALTSVSATKDSNGKAIVTVKATERPLSASNKPSSTSDKSTSASDKPTSASDKHTSASDKSTSGSDKPASTSDKPTVASDTSTLISNKPTSTSDKTSASSKPAVASDKIPASDTPTLVPEKPTSASSAKLGDKAATSKLSEKPSSAKSDSKSDKKEKKDDKGKMKPGKDEQKAAKQEKKEAKKQKVPGKAVKKGEPSPITKEAEDTVTPLTATPSTGKAKWLALQGRHRELMMLESPRANGRPGLSRTESLTVPGEASPGRRDSYSPVRRGSSRSIDSKLSSIDLSKIAANINENGDKVT